MRIVAWLIVAAAGLVSGGFAIPLGAALGLSAIEVYGSAVAGSTAGMLLFLLGGDRIRAKLAGGPREESVESDSRIREVVDRHGARGLGLVGPIFPGVTASVVLGLALRLDRRELATWMSAGIVVLYAIYTAGLWLLLEVVGVD